MICNGERYIRQVIKSTTPYVSKHLIFDTGSTDRTLEYIKELQKEYPQIELHETPVNKKSIEWDGNHLSLELTSVRNRMLELTKTKWVWQVDDDEIYSIQSIYTLAKGLDYINLSENNWIKGLTSLSM